MAQHDYSIDNQDFPATRADINSAFGAVVTNNSGATTPTITYEYMWWVDTSTDTVKMLNAARTAWIDFVKLDTANDHVELQSNVVQAVSAAGITFKNNAGSTILNVSDTGNITVVGTVDGVDIAAEEARLANTSGTNTGDEVALVQSVWDAGTDTTEATISPAKNAGAMQALFAEIMHVSADFTSGTGGGGKVMGWQTRPLNTVNNAGITGASLASNRVTITAGTYKARAVAQAYGVNSCQLRIYNITGSATLVTGVNFHPNSGGYGRGINGELEGVFTVSVTTEIELQQYSDNANSGAASMGFPNSAGTTERYAYMILEKIG